MSKYYDFGEKNTEKVGGKELPVFQSAKYKSAKEKAIEIIENGKYGLTEGDFWILMNTYNNGEKMMYSGLILSHTGCLKINDKLETKFDPASVRENQNGYNNSLVFTYSNKEQGIYEVGEVAPGNYKMNGRNDYPYAMAFKRCFDRVVLKLSKLAYSGIYSESESDDFKKQDLKQDLKPKQDVKQDANSKQDLKPKHLGEEQRNYQSEINTYSTLLANNSEQSAEEWVAKAKEKYTIPKGQADVLIKWWNKTNKDKQ